ncbi:hypothetical protein RUM43_011048 [Polyplax serrata]|uniref:Retinol dehydrogenase 12 n=1 Tax=Polyplax serrata TaxID=468196 RepID=A0AAN8P4G6_POLSC
MGLFGQKWVSNVRLDGKTAIITGCNTGIGKFNVLDFYKRGCRVIMACRDLVKAETAKSDIEKEVIGQDNLGTIVVEKLDLASLSSVRQFAEQILKQEQKIDYLINNAGVMACPKAITEDGYEMQFATNHLGHFLLTILLLPRIIQSAPARIVNLSSAAHMAGNINFDDLNLETNYSPISAYGRSKLANILFTKELAKRLGDRQVKVYAVHPGVVKTDLGRHMDSVVFSGFQRIYRTFFGFFMKTVEDGSRTQIYCALDEKAGQETGLYYSDCKVKEPWAKATDMETAKKLWDVSWEMVKLGDFDPFKPDSKIAWER